jgi:hypothetical protein
LGETALLELLASYVAALEIADRAMSIARQLAEAHRDERRMSDAAIADYLVRSEGDAARLADLRLQISTFQNRLRVH